MLITAEELAARLARQGLVDPERIPGGSRSAVAAILRFDRDEPQVLLMQRAERVGDRWSGQVSFPGGREDDGDPDLLATAVRETREEVGLDLGRARLLGRLASMPALPRGATLPMTVSPFVFAVDPQHDDASLVLSAEATATFWLPLARAAGGGLDSQYDYVFGQKPMRLPCWRFEDRVVWGLTYMILSGLLTELKRRDVR